MAGLLPGGEGMRAADKPSHMELYHTINVVTAWPEMLNDVCVLYLFDTDSYLRVCVRQRLHLRCYIWHELPWWQRDLLKSMDLSVSALHLRCYVPLALGRSRQRSKCLVSLV